MKRILVFGSGGHAKVVAETAQCMGIDVVGWIDGNREVGEQVHGNFVLGPLDMFPYLLKEYPVDGGVVAIGDNWARLQVVRQILDKVPDFKFATLIHPTAYVSHGTEVHAGSVVFAQSVVQVGAVLQEHCLVNTGATLDHDCRMETGSSLAPGVHVGGHVNIGAYSAVGIGATISHGVQIEAHAVIGAGSVVMNRVPSHVVAYGVPCRVVRERQEGERYL